MLYNLYYGERLLQKSISPEQAAELYELYVDAYYEDPTVALDPTQIKLEPVFKGELIMAMRSKTGDLIIPTPKKSRQGCGQHTKYAATSRNKARKRYRGQGKR